MCQLLGVISNKPVDISLSLREFQHRGAENRHGWGFAFLKEGGWNVIKKPVPLSDENISERKFAFKSKIIIGHVRLATCGIHIHPNTHPFSIGGWAFAHNGTVSGIMNKSPFKLKEQRPEGGTDSEYAFCYLIGRIRERPDDIPALLEEESARIATYGGFNYLLSDGKTLYAYGHDRLYITERRAPFHEVTLKDDDYTVDLNEIKDQKERAVLVATEPLTEGEKWERVKGLRVFGEDA